MSPKRKYIFTPEGFAAKSRIWKGKKLPRKMVEKSAASRTGKKLAPGHAAKNRENLRQFNENPEERNQAISQALRAKGYHGFGGKARDNPGHLNALHWVVKDSSGREYEFDNLQSWARKNEQLFLPDARPESRLPLWRRFAAGMDHLRKGTAPSWRGWTLISPEKKEQL